VVPFSIALINQASCAADSKQFFSIYSQMFFLLLRSCEYKATACMHHPFWLGASRGVAFIFISFSFLFHFFLRTARLFFFF
jgi:hypothetical protein